MVGRCRDVGYHLCSGHGQSARRRHGHPQVLAYLDTDLGAVTLEDAVSGKMCGNPSYLDVSLEARLEGSPPAPLVELAVVGYI